MESILENFIDEKTEEIIQKNLINNFHLHLINLHDHAEISDEVVIKIERKFSTKRENLVKNNFN